MKVVRASLLGMIAGAVIAALAVVLLHPVASFVVWEWVEIDWKGVRLFGVIGAFAGGLIFTPLLIGWFRDD